MDGASNLSGRDAVAGFDHQLELIVSRHYELDDQATAKRGDGR